MKPPARRPPAPARLKPFLIALRAYNPQRLAWVIVLQLAASLSQGVAALLLVPMLELAGVGHSADAGGLLGFTRRIFAAFGVRLTLGSMLVVYVGVVAVAAALNAYQTVELTRYRLTFCRRSALTLVRRGRRRGMAPPAAPAPIRHPEHAYGQRRAGQSGNRGGAEPQRRATGDRRAGGWWRCGSPRRSRVWRPPPVWP
jgi:hypothetical protein